MRTTVKRSARRAVGLTALPLAMMLTAIDPSVQAQTNDGAPQPGFSRLTAVSATDPWVPPTGITIETRDTDLDGVDGPRVSAVRDTIRQSLGERGIAVGPPGSHVLSFMITVAPSPAPPPAARDEPAPMDKPYVPPTASYRSLEVVDQVTVPLGERDADDISSHLSISFRVFVPGEAPLWHATIMASGEVEDPVDLVQKMTRAAMGALGRSEQRTFTSSCTGAEKATGTAGHCLR